MNSAVTFLSRHKYAAAIVAALLAIGLVGYSLLRVPQGAGTSTANTIADAIGVDAMQDTLNSLLGRSPGERTLAELSKGKGARRMVPLRYVPDTRGPAGDGEGAPGPASRIIERPDDGLGQGPFDTPNELLGGPEGSDAGSPGSLAPIGSTGPGGGVTSVLPGGPGGISIGGGGGGGSPGNPGGPGGPGGPGNPDPEPPVVPAVPEPSTWFMLLLGMGFVGASMRRGKAYTGRVSIAFA